jgi:hypothetical protein
MATQFISRHNVLTILGAIMIVIVTFPVALIWFGQPLGNAAITMADAFASVFSAAFFSAFALAMSSSRPAVADHIDDSQITAPKTWAVR